MEFLNCSEPQDLRVPAENETLAEHEQYGCSKVIMFALVLSVCKV